MTTNYKEALLNTRESTHGNFKDMAVTAQTLKDCLRLSKSWRYLNLATKEALDSICLKLARIVDGDEKFPEHTKDIKGYADLIAHWNPPSSKPMTIADINEANKLAQKTLVSDFEEIKTGKPKPDYWRDWDEAIERSPYKPFFAPEPGYLSFYNDQQAYPAFITYSEYELLKNLRNGGVKIETTPETSGAHEGLKQGADTGLSTGRANSKL